MEIETEKLLLNAIKDGLRDGVKQRMANAYGSNPFDAAINETLKSHGGEIRALINEAMSSAISDEAFRASMREQIRSILAKTLVQRFGGELEQQVNKLKSDPATRARITLAIEEIVKSKT